MATRIQFRRGLAASWTSANPTLAQGEMGIELDTDLFKIGDGVLAWNALPYGGLQGPEGAQGTSINVIGSVEDEEDLPASAEQNDAYIVQSNGDLYIWDTVTDQWDNVGQIVGPQGPQGDAGATGATGATGPGVASGGTEGQVLLKVDGTDYNTVWADNSAESTFYLVRNNTGATIPKGTLVTATGAEPSGRIDVAPYEVTGLENSELRVMGVATANINSGSNGTVMSFGTLKAIDTRGNVTSAIAVGDETWAAGDILYAHPTVPGKLTNVRPQHDLVVAFITLRHQSAGQIAVRITSGTHLEWLHDVLLNSPSDGEVLTYNEANSVWENAPLTITVIDGGTA